VKLPAAIGAQIEAATSDRVTGAHSVSGGCISQTARVEFQSGDRAFLKYNEGASLPAGLFAEEARSLIALAATDTVRVPRVIAQDTRGDQWLLLEWLEPGPRTSANQRRLGEQLAHLHRHSNDQFGWPSRNFIGSLPQSNDWNASWPAFWRAQRLEPQLQQAASHLGASARNRFDQLIDDLPELLGEVSDEGPSLLHGDLWSGNMHLLADGSPAVIDPSCYYGHREVDIAMARLFGGFSREFYEAYDAVWPHRPEMERRVSIYQLYYLLVHINLFGGSYVPQTMSVMEQLGY
jgi:protein-ribulosamine 3-kinase